MFVPHKTAAGQVIPWEYLPAGAITPKVGLALVMTDGKLAVASGATPPTYICMREQEDACEEGAILPVIRVDRETIWETSNSESFSGVKVGQSVNMSDDGLQVTAAAGSVCEVVGFDEAAEQDADGKVWVRFPTAPAAQ